MQPNDKSNVLDRLDRLFGRGWRKLYADAIGVRHATITEMAGPTLKFTSALAEFFETTPPRRWPERFAGLADLRKQKLTTDKQKETASHDHD